MATDRDEASEAEPIGAPPRTTVTAGTRKRKAKKHDPVGEASPADEETPAGDASTDDAEPTAAEPGAAKPRKKKKKAKRTKPRAAASEDRDSDDAEAAQDADEDAGPDPDLLPGEGTDEGAKLREAYRAFEAGDYGLVRELTKALGDAKDADVRAYAVGLARRIAIDPYQVGVVVVCFGVLAWVVYTWIL